MPINRVARCNAIKTAVTKKAFYNAKDLLAHKSVRSNTSLITQMSKHGMLAKSDDGAYVWMLKGPVTASLADSVYATVAKATKASRDKYRNSNPRIVQEQISALKGDPEIENNPKELLQLLIKEVKSLRLSVESGNTKTDTLSTRIHLLETTFISNR